MRKEKFEFPRKGRARIVDPKNTAAVRAALKEEEHFNPSNSMLLTNYFFMRDFMQEMVKEESDFIITGSSSWPMYNESLRVPTDLDLKTNSPQRILDLIRHIADAEKDANMVVGDAQHTGNDVIKTHVDFDLNGLLGRFYIDVQTDDSLTNQIMSMRKVISTDQVFDAKGMAVEESVAHKIDSILNKLTKPRNPYYRIKDFYDIYMLCKENDVNKGLVNDYLNQLIGVRSKEGAKCIQENLGELVVPNQDLLWSSFRRKHNPRENDKEKIIETVKGLIQDMEI